MSRKKLLIITFTSPYPATDGGKISVFGSVNYLRNYYDIKLAYPSSKKESESDKELKGLWHNVEIFPFVPEEKMLEKLVQKVVKYPSKKYTKLKSFLFKKQQLKSPMPDFAFNTLSKKYISFIEALLNSHKYDLIQVEYTKYLSLIEILPQNTKRVFVQIENRFSLLEDYYRLHGWSQFAENEVRRTAILETGLINKFDLVLALSPKDKEILERYVSPEKVYYSPFPVLDSMLNHKEYAVQKKLVTKLVFIGSENHYPNKDAVEWFNNSIMPCLSGFQFYVTGSWSNKFKKANTNIIFTGFIDDLSGVLEDSIMVCPIRIGGGGIRAKILQAMAMKVPVVSTRLGCFGIPGTWKEKPTLLMADEEQQIINGIKKLAEDYSLREQIVCNAFDLISDMYTEKAIGEVRRKIYDAVM